MCQGNSVWTIATLVVAAVVLFGVNFYVIRSGQAKHHFFRLIFMDIALTMMFTVIYFFVSSTFC
jgi:hypothetical protein